MINNSTNCLQEELKINSIHQLLEERVKLTPDAVAVVFGNEQLTYFELNSKVNQLARYLQKLGVKPEVLVGICLERSIEMVVGLLAILKAGGAYVPLDPNYPKERLDYMLSDTRVSLVLTQNNLFDEFKKPELKIICLNTEWETISKESQENPVNQVVPENLAYVMFTSGSTGKPKGVQIPRANIWHYVNSINKVLQVQSNDVYLHTASFSFSSSVRQLMVPLSQGSKVIVASHEQTKNPLKLFELIRKQDITIFDTVPSIWRYGLEALESLDSVAQKELLQSKLRLITFSGGVLPCKLLKKVRDKLNEYTLGDRNGNQPRIANVFGQTETIGVCAYPIPTEFDREEGYVPVGYNYEHTQVYILDSNLVPVKPGEKGELHVAGKSLARGYLNRPDLTSERFIDNPFNNDSNTRLYKTGDVARYLPDGTIEILGRLDHQVKIREMRVELGEIELVLEQHPSIRETVVTAVEDPSNGDKRLIGYVVPELLPDGSSQKIVTREIRSFLQGKLPEYMVPSAFITLDKLPLTPNGKLNRQGLPAPDTSNIQLENNFVPPTNPTEEILATIWADVLGVEKVGIHDNFFELGGHSLLAMRLVAEIEKVTQKKLPLVALSQFTTISELANQIQNEQVAQKPNSNLDPELPQLNVDDLRTLLTLAAGRGGTRIRPDSLINAIFPRGDKPPLFYCANATKEISTLSKYLGEEQPIYLLESGFAVFEPRDQLNRPSHKDIKAIAARHVRDMLEIYPQGPYLLVGYSFGRFVAYEVAKQLQERGKQVDFLGILDAPGSGKMYRYVRKLQLRIVSMTEELSRGSLLNFAGLFGSLLGRIKDEFTKTLLKTKEEGRRKKEEGWNCNGDLNPNAILTPYDRGELNPYLEVKRAFSSKKKIDFSAIDKTSEVGKQGNNLKERKSISPLATNKGEYIMEGYQGKITLFIAPIVHLTHEKIQRLLFPLLGWDKHRVDIIRVSGDHYSMVKEPDVKVLADSLKISIDKVLENRKS